jgi:hypothetical protein
MLTSGTARPCASDGDAAFTNDLHWACQQSRCFGLAISFVFSVRYINRARAAVAAYWLGIRWVSTMMWNWLIKF